MAENPQVFKAHLGLIRSIAWLEDDTGFISSGWDAAVYVWKLNQKENTPIWEYKMKSVNFTCVTTFKPEGTTKPLIYATGTDKTIRELIEGNNQIGKESLRYEQQVVLSQIGLMHNRRALFCGVSEQNKPGSIQVLKYPYEKTFEIQSHSLAVERLRLSYDNQTLFSASVDGTLAVFSIQERDSKKKDKELPTIQYSEFILIQQAHRNKI